MQLDRVTHGNHDVAFHIVIGLGGNLEFCGNIAAGRRRLRRGRWVREYS